MADERKLSAGTPAVWTSVADEESLLERGRGRRLVVVDEPLLEPHDVVAVAVDRRGLSAVQHEVVEERLVDFGERRGGIPGLVHVEAPSASADLSGSSFAVG